MRKDIQPKGFSAIEAIIIVVVVLAVGLGGWWIWQRNANGDNPVNDKRTSQQNDSQQNNNTKLAQPDPYVDWQTYCDNIYHYCFKYPKDWKISVNTALSIGDPGGALLLNPARTVAIYYDNQYSQDAGAMDFVTVSIERLAKANQDLTVVGGYIPSSGPNGVAGNNVPSYQIVDSSILEQYPLEIDKTSSFVNNPRFSDKNISGLSYHGRLKAEPAVSINSIEETNSWFQNTDTKTALLVLESLYYSPPSSD